MNNNTIPAITALSQNLSQAGCVLFGGLSVRRARALVKLNLSNTRSAYICAALFFLFLCAQLVLTLIGLRNGERWQQSTASIGSVLLLLPPLCALRIGRKHYRCIMGLGGKRQDFFYGSLITYIVLAAAVSAANGILYHTYDKLLIRFHVFDYVSNILESYNWLCYGIAVAFVRQWMFLFFVAAFCHTVAFCQGSWAGWAVNITLAAFFIASNMYEPLRYLKYRFWYLLTSYPHAALQIIVCATAALAVYALTWPLVRGKDR